MDREEEILNAAVGICLECFAKRAVIIEETFKSSYIDIIKDFIIQIDGLFKEAINLQKQGKKSDVSIIYISYLHSNFLLNKYGFQINLYDEYFFLDEDEVAIDWNPKCVFGDLDKDIETIEKVLKSKVIRFKKYELIEVKKGYIINFYRFAEGLVKAIVPCIERMYSFKELKKDKTVKVLLGEYMGEFVPLYEFKVEVEENEVLSDAN